MEIRRTKDRNARTAPQSARVYAGIVELTPEELHWVAGGMRAPKVDAKGLRGN